MAFSIKKKLPIHPSFLLLFLWFILTQNFSAFFIFVSVVLTHEFGHYIVAKKLGYKLDSFFLAPYGVSLNYKEKVFESADEIKIALAGPAVNLFLAIIAVTFWWVLPESYAYTNVFVYQSIILGLFNLLPCYPLDGGRILVGLLNGKMERKKSITIVTALNYLFAFVSFLFFVVSCLIDFNPTFALCTCFLLLGVIQGKRESKYSLATVFKKKTKDFSKPIIFVVNASVTIGELLKKIQSNKFTCFYCVLENGKTKFLDEKLVLDLSLIFPYNMKLETIFNHVSSKERNKS